MIVEIRDKGDAKKIADALHLMRGVTKIAIHSEEPFERIPGLPYTQEERIAAIHRAEEDYAAGRFVTSDELRKKHPRI